MQNSRSRTLKAKISLLAIVGYNVLGSEDNLGSYFVLRSTLICDNAPELCIDCEARIRDTNECIPNYMISKLLGVDPPR